MRWANVRAMQLFHEAGIKVTMIPYKGDGPDCELPRPKQSATYKELVRSLAKK